MSDTSDDRHDGTEEDPGELARAHWSDGDSIWKSSVDAEQAAVEATRLTETEPSDNDAAGED